MKLIFAFLFLAVVGFACSAQGPSAATEQIATVTPFTLLPTLIPSPTPPEEIIPVAPPTFTPAPQPTFTPKSTPGTGWFEITELLPAEPITSKAARSFIGITVPPLPENIIQEFSTYDVVGETSSSTIVHQAIVVRQGNARMLWIGVPFWPTDNGAEIYTKIYDSIPLPVTQPGDVLVAFTCAHNNESDFSLIVIAAKEKTALDIHYAWRVNPSSSTLESVSYRDIICWSN